MHTASDPLYWNVICTHVWYRHLLLYKLRDVRVNVSLTTNGNSPDLWMLLIFTLSSRSRIWWHFNPHRYDKEEGNVVIILEMYASPEYTQRKKKKQEEAKKKKKKKKISFIRRATTTTQTNRYGWKRLGNAAVGSSCCSTVWRTSVPSCSNLLLYFISRWRFILGKVLGTQHNRQYY